MDEPIGSSDHSPIIIEVSDKVKYVSPLNRSAKWKSRDVDWDSFKQTADDNILDPNEARRLSAKERVSKFCEALIESGNTHVGKVKPSKNSKPWMSPPIRAAIR